MISVDNYTCSTCTDGHCISCMHVMFIVDNMPRTLCALKNLMNGVTGVLILLRSEEKEEAYEKVRALVSTSPQIKEPLRGLFEDLAASFQE